MKTYKKLEIPKDSAWERKILIQNVTLENQIFPNRMS